MSEKAGLLGHCEAVRRKEAATAWSTAIAAVRAPGADPSNGEKPSAKLTFQPDLLVTGRPIVEDTISVPNSSEQFNALIALYHQGRLHEALAHGTKLAAQYPDVPLIPNILGAVNALLGRLDEAVAHYAKALQIKPDFAEVHNNLGNALNGLGRHREALASHAEAIRLMPNFAAAHFNLGNGLTELGRPEEAITSYANALRLQPDYAEAHSNVGIVLNDLGRHEPALEHLSKAVQLKPDFAQAHNNLGNALNRLGRHQEGLASLTTALQLAPDYAEAHNNLGNALNGLGRYEEACTSLTKALQLKPDFAEAHNNYGMVLNNLGEHQQALVRLGEALRHRNDFAEAHNNFGIALDNLGRHQEALASYTRALALAPERKDIWHNFATAAQKVSFAAYSEQLEKAFLSLLAQESVASPSQLARPILRLLKLHPLIDESLQIVDAGVIQKTAPEICAQLSTIPLFLRIIELCPIPDPKVETLLTELRKALLLNGELARNEPSVVRFHTALALHCFTNEYIFEESDDERRAIEALETDLEMHLANRAQRDLSKPNLFKIVCLASYRPLHRYAWSHNLTIPERLMGLWKRQIVDVLEEASLRPGIGRLRAIEDPVSNAVREQYEENPYPRWVHTRLLAKRLSISALTSALELKLIDAPQTFSDQPNILVAGCGTGQHSLMTASRFLNCQVLAVDLSLSSLSYAIRKTREMGVSNIAYMQADILDLEKLDRQFDIVESVGVLHHMADPMAGWKVLTHCLKPGGLMNIGLYSELARKPVVAARNLISAMALDCSQEDMRAFRKHVLHRELEDSVKELVGGRDFYAASTCRDLLFHVREHRFTLPQIGAALDMLGLTFAGFEFANAQTMKKFKHEHADPHAVTSLDAWHAFETANPNIFRGMYQFWVQKNH